MKVCAISSIIFLLGLGADAQLAGAGAGANVGGVGGANAGLNAGRKL